MSLVKWAFIGVILLPVAEFAAFMAMVLAVGWLWTATLFVATSAAGVLVLRRAGRTDLDRFRTAVNVGGIRAIGLDTPGLAPIIGGILLVLPGFITDMVGVLLLLPPARRLISAAIRRRLRKSRAARGPVVIDLAPTEWRQISSQTSDTIEDGREHLSGRRHGP